jgi:5-methylcytosine-specific restriction protein A
MAWQLDRVETLLDEAFSVLAESALTVDEQFDAVRLWWRVERRAQAGMVAAVADLERRGGFAERGVRAATALTGMLRMDGFEARRVVTAAQNALPRLSLAGEALPAVLPATADAFHAGRAGVREVEAIAQLMRGPVARRLDVDLQEFAELELASRTGEWTPSELRSYGTRLLDRLDQDGPSPDDDAADPVSELFLTPDRSRGGGRLKGRLSAEVYERVAAVLAAKSAPLTADDDRSLGERQADALAEVFGYVSAHADSDVLPSAGGERPQVHVHIDWDDLRREARAAFLDHGGRLTPSELRWLCCDAAVIPIVLGGAGQPLDVGRLRRSIPDGIRRAVTARDRGCAHPGCDRPPAFCEIHHVIPWEHGGATTLSNLVMLCRVHHREMHSSGWEVRIAADGIPEFTPPAWVDTFRAPRRRPRPPGWPPDPPPDPSLVPAA